MSPNFSYYELCYDFNKRQVVPFNIFQNSIVYERTLREVKKYVRNPKKYKYYSTYNNEYIYGFEGFCYALDVIVMCEEWSRCEYEMGVCDKFETNINNVCGTDCYEQFKPNCEMVAREVIYQYKKYLKESKNGND